MNKKRKIIYLIIAIALLISVFHVCYTKYNKTDTDFIENNVLTLNDISDTQNIIDNFIIPNETKEITDIEEIRNYKERYHAIGDDELYVIKDYGNGIKSLEIKSSINYNVMMAGILKKGKPNKEEIEALTYNAPEKNGIWIEQNSRIKILNLINNTTNNSFEINNEGYLTLKSNINNNSIDKDDIILNTLIEMISGNKKIVLSVTDTIYQLDSISGEIIEYPFERMDPYDMVETYVDNNNILYFITTNLENKVSNEEIIPYILEDYKIR